MDSNRELVDYLKRRGRIRSPEVEQAFRNVDRGNFVPDGQENRAYEDTPLPIGHGSTISAPHMVAENTELLEVEKGSRVAEVGSGSGYQLAILAELTDSSATGVEIVEELVNRSREALQPWPNAGVVSGSGLEPLEGDFDRVLYSCAVKSFEAAENRISDGGVIVAPVETGGGQVLKKYRGGEVTEHGSVRFVSFRGD